MPIDKSNASTPGGERGGSQEIAKRAADHAMEALNTVIDHMRSPTRQTVSVLQAARMVLEMAKELQPESKPAQLYRIDPKLAAEELKRRMEAGEK